MKARYLTSVFCAAFVVTSCSDRGQEMEEKVTQMQRQLDDAQKQLQAANQALASRAPAGATTETVTAASSTTGGLPSRDAVEQSYSASVSAFRKDLDANLKDFRVESCTTHSVQMPTEFFPFTSQLSLALVSADGKNFTTDIPVKADVAGKWVFPTVAEVTQRIEKANRAASTATSSRSTAQNQPASAQPAPYMKVDGTFVIQWPDSNTNASRAATRTPAPVESTPVAAASAPPPPRPQPTSAQPPSRPGANPVMPVDRDVQIQFPSPP
jgi:hypothetical protein